jgi:hypothetical protein
MPSHQDFKLKVRIKAYQTIERAGLVWVACGGLCFRETGFRSQRQTREMALWSRFDPGRDEPAIRKPANSALFGKTQEISV